MFDDRHRFGRMEARRATKRNVNYPTLAQPNAQGWGTGAGGRRRNPRENTVMTIPYHPRARTPG